MGLPFCLVHGRIGAITAGLNSGSRDPIAWKAQMFANIDLHG